MSLREKNKQLTRQSILDTARAMFKEQGYRRTTTVEIARKVGMAEGTLYNYYRTKADLFIAAMLPELEAAEDRDGGIDMPIMPRLDAEEWARALVSMIDRRLSGLAAADKSVMREYFALVFGSASRDSSEEKSGLLRSDELMMREMHIFFKTQKEAYASLSHFDEDRAVQSVFAVVVYHLSLYALDESYDYARLLAGMEDQMAFNLHGHLSSSIKS